MKLFIVHIKNLCHTGIPLVNKNVYWPAIGNLVYHWSIVLYDVIFYRYYKDLPIKFKNFLKEEYFFLYQKHRFSPAI